MTASAYTLKDWTDGDVLYSTDLEADFKGVYRCIGVQTTGGTGTNITNSQVGSTLTIPANKVSNHIMILLQSTISCSGATSGTSTIQIYIGETGSESSKITYTKLAGSQPASTALQNCDVFIYAPTASEIANGFNIKIYGTTGDAGRTIGYTQLNVLGG